MKRKEAQRGKKKEEAVIVQTLAEVKSALKNGATILQNAPDALHYQGALYLKEMLAQGGFDAAKHRFVLHGDDASLMLGALREGFKVMRFEGPREVKKKLKDIVAQVGGELVES